MNIGILMLHTTGCHFEILGRRYHQQGIEIAREDFKRRLDALDWGGDPFSPEVYQIWARDHDGDYTIAYEVRESDAVL